MPVFYPSCVCNLKIRFDESLHVQALGAPLAIEDAIENPARGGGSPAVEPLVVQRGDSTVSFVSGRVPLAASVELPGYRQAGQFSCKFAFRDLPIDPRTVRAAAVDIHLGTVPARDFAAGMSGGEADGTRKSILRTRDAAGVPDRRTLAITGMVDEWSVSHDSSGSFVEFRGRDLRGALLDTNIATAPVGAQLLEQLDLSVPIHEVVQQILDQYPFFQEFVVAVNPAEWKDGVVPSPGDAGSTPRHRRGARGTRTARGGAPGAQTDLNFWDLIVRYCYLVGAIPHFVGNELRVRPSRSVFDQARGGFDPDTAFPFQGGAPRRLDSVSGATLEPFLRVRRLVYGRDIESLSFDRKFGGYRKPTVVRAVSCDVGGAGRGDEKILEGVWPPGEAGEAPRRSRASAGGQNDGADVLNVPVPGIVSEDRLQEIARSIFEEIGRGEMGGSCQTKNLTSFGGDNQDPDLVSLRPGDGVELHVDTRPLGATSPLVSALTDHSRESFERQIAIVAERLGGDQNLARVMVATSRGAIQEMQRFFRVANVKFDWADSGIKVAFDFQNYVVPRLQVEAASDAPGEVVRVTARSRRPTAAQARDDANLARARDLLEGG